MTSFSIKTEIHFQYQNQLVNFVNQLVSLTSSTCFSTSIRYINSFLQLSSSGGRKLVPRCHPSPAQHEQKPYNTWSSMCLPGTTSSPAAKHGLLVVLCVYAGFCAVVYHRIRNRGLCGTENMKSFRQHLIIFCAIFTINLRL